ncbi:MAG: tetratricopeptide repeat protein [Candidatus Brocadiia bacterium]
MIAASKAAGRGEQIACYDRAIEFDPGYARAYCLRAGAYSRAGQTEGAIRDLTKAIELDPREPQAYFERGREYIGQGEFRLGVEDIWRSVSIGWSQAGLRHGVARRALRPALEHFRKVLQMDPGNSDALLYRGLALAAGGAYARALHQLKPVTEKRPGCAEAWRCLGQLSVECGCPEDAVVFLGESIKIDPDHARARTLLGRALDQTGEHERAIRVLTVAIRMAPGLREACYYRTEAYRHAGKEALASRDLNHVAPEGYVRCEKCGEFNGKTPAKNLNWGPHSFPHSPDRLIGVTCLCHGIPCPRCGERKIHRPISNSYAVKSNTVEHWPWFSGMMPCSECRKQEKNPWTP